MDVITQLTVLDAEELHLVKAGANGFRPAMAKADPNCSTCHGKGTIMDGNRKCPDCAGAGDATTTEKALACGCEACLWITDASKAEISGKAANDLPDSAFAYIEPDGTKDAEGKTVPRSLRHFPIHDKAHAANALARAPQSPFGAKAMPKIKAAAKKFGIQVEGEAPVEKSEPTIVIKDDGTMATILSASNGDKPGSPAWEQQDAQVLLDAGNLLAQAGAKLKAALDREQTEVAVGLNSDQGDVFDLEDALCALDAVLGITARLAMTEQVEGQAQGMSKAGRRLSKLSVGKIVATRDKAGELATHLTDLLGPDDPTKAVGPETAKKGASEMEMTKEQFDEAVKAEATTAADAAVKAALEARETAEREAAAKAKADKAEAKKAKAEKAAEKRKVKAEKAVAKKAKFQAKQDAMSDDEKKAAADDAAEKSRRKQVAKAIRLQAKLVEKGIDPSGSDTLAKELQAVKAQLEKLQNEPVHGGLLLNGAGLSAEAAKALGLGALQRGGDTKPRTADEIMKSYETKIDEARKSGKIGQVEFLEAESRYEAAKALEVQRGYPTKTVNA